jgi:acetyltransferase
VECLLLSPYVEKRRAAPHLKIMTIRNLEHALAPRSVAVIGASAEKGSVGNVLTANVLGGGFAGKVFLVNPHDTEIAGQPCFR